MRKIIMASITAVVVIAVLAGTLMPVLDDATAKEDTYHNDGYVFANVLDSSSSTVITWDYTTPKILTIDGEDVDLTDSLTAYGGITVAFSDTWLIRYTSSGIRIYQADGDNTNLVTSATTSNTNSFSLTVASGAATIVCGSTTLDYSVSGNGVVIANEGDYVLKKGSETAYMNGDSEFYAAGRTDNAVGTASINLIASGTIDDGLTISQAPSSLTLSSSAINATADADHIDLYDLTGFTATYTDGTNTGTITYTQFFVPYEVTAERTVQFTDGEDAILNAIPVIVIVALLLGVIALVLRSRMD